MKKVGREFRELFSICQRFEIEKSDVGKIKLSQFKPGFCCHEFTKEDVGRLIVEHTGLEGSMWWEFIT